MSEAHWATVRDASIPPTRRIRLDVRVSDLPERDLFGQPEPRSSPLSMRTLVLDWALAMERAGVFFVL